MNDQNNQIPITLVDDLYADAGHWHVNTGEETIHAKRMPGKWRTLKWWANSFWLLFFLGPFVRWGDQQAVLFDIPNRQFHIFGVTILPQDFWMLALLLLFFAILLAVVTAVAGRVWCGFFCFQTVWTDLYTWIEEKLEGNPQKRRKLDAAPWGFSKIKTKVIKHALWLVIALLTGISFVAWFIDIFSLLGGLWRFELGFAATLSISMFVVGTYILAGFMREQTCLWLCPYARIQGVMIDNSTVLPTYDLHRGEPRGRLKKNQVEAERSSGDCIDCNQCVAVCPTGIDIRQGQQEGCITCALCIDACDSVMEKIGRPKGLIRYDSLDGLEQGVSTAIAKRPRVWVYSGILLAALGGIVYGLSTLDAVELNVLHERQPLFVLQSNGSIQNKYTLKVLNKMKQNIRVMVTAEGPEGALLVGAENGFDARNGNVTAHTVFVRVPAESLTKPRLPIIFRITTTVDGEQFSGVRKSVFMGPSH